MHGYRCTRSGLSLVVSTKDFFLVFMLEIEHFLHIPSHFLQVKPGGSVHWRSIVLLLQLRIDELIQSVFCVSKISLDILKVSSPVLSTLLVPCTRKRYSTGISLNLHEA